MAGIRKWDDKYKFWAETYRTIAFAIIGYLLVTPIQNLIANNTEKYKWDMATKPKLIDDFEVKSFIYNARAYDAGKGYSGGTATFEDTAYEEYAESKIHMRRYFSDDIKTMLVESDTLSKRLHEALNTHKINNSDNTWIAARKNLMACDNKIADKAFLEADLPNNKGFLQRLF